MHCSFISGELNVDESDVESLLVSCILDGTVAGRIDQVSYQLIMLMTTVKIVELSIVVIHVWTLIRFNYAVLEDSREINRVFTCPQVNGVLELDQKSDELGRYKALDKWGSQLNQLQKAVVNKMS
jgi:hypothetical protein